MSDTTGSTHLSTGAKRRMTSRRRQLVRYWQEYRWVVMGGVWLAAGTLGYVGFAKHFAALGQPRSPGDLLYLTLQLFVLESGSVVGPMGWELEVARFLAPAVAASTAMQALALLFYEQSHLLRVRFVRDHVVICGLGSKGLLLARGFRERGHRVVVIELDEDNELIEQCRELGAIVLIGNAASQEFLLLSRVHLAKSLFAVSGDDGANAEVAVCAHELVAERPGRALTCVVHIVDRRLCDLLREQELETGKADRFRLEFFNVFDSGARAVLTQYPPFGQVPDQKPHLLVVGLGQMGSSLVVHAARSWWVRYVATNERLRMSIIDREAEQKVESLGLRYPQLRTACELLPLSMEIQGPDFERGDFLYGSDGGCDVTIAYVCLDDDSFGLSTALALRQRVREAGIPIVVRMRHDAGLATLLSGLDGDDKGFESLYAFGLLDRTCTPELVLGGTHELLAQLVHEEYRRGEDQAGQTPQTSPAMVPWDSLPEDKKESNRRQVDHMDTKLEAIGCGIARLTDWDAASFPFADEEIELMARMEHERWFEEQRRDRWTYAPGPKDAEKKTHPDLVSWEALPDPEKEKSRNVVRELPSFLARAGFQICRWR